MSNEERIDLIKREYARHRDGQCQGWPICFHCFLDKMAGCKTTPEDIIKAAKTTQKGADE